VLLTEWEEFRHADPDLLGYVVAERRVVDARHALDADAYRAAGWEYRALGHPAVASEPADVVSAPARATPLGSGAERAGGSR